MFSVGNISFVFLHNKTIPSVTKFSTVKNVMNLVLLAIHNVLVQFLENQIILNTISIVLYKHLLNKEAILKGRGMG